MAYTVMVHVVMAYIGMGNVLPSPVQPIATGRRNCAIDAAAAKAACFFLKKIGSTRRCVDKKECWPERSVGLKGVLASRSVGLNQCQAQRSVGLKGVLA